MSPGQVGPESESLAGRLFLAVTPPRACRDAIARSVDEGLDGRALPGRRVPPERWHLTLKFLGETSDGAARRLCAAMDEADLVAGFRLRFAGLGAFPNAGRAKVLWMGCDEGASSLIRLASAVDEAAVDAGFEAETRPYRPHLTLSRLRPPQDLRALIEGFNAAGRAGPGPESAEEGVGLEAAGSAAVMWVGRVRLYRSQLGHRSVRYEALRSW